MRLILIIFILLLTAFHIAAQQLSAVSNNSTQSSSDSLNTLAQTDSSKNTLTVVTDQRPVKLGKAIVSSLGLDAVMFGTLLLMPQSISKWDPATKFDSERLKNQYHSTFTRPPHIDSDLWMINYVGHPYQGSFYYNSLRSRGGNMWQSALFTLGQSLLWEYAIEGSMEQPSVQDLIVTPILGSVLGELTMRACTGMSKNGFRWYEKVTACIINPAWVIEHGFRPTR